MTGRPTDDELLETLRIAQRFGVLGPVRVVDVVAHARAFVAALEPVHGRVVDLGSGAGVPGLVVAHDRPDLEIVLVDRRSKRTDLLERAIRRLGMDGRVEVRCEDVEQTISNEPAAFDGVTARSFGPPSRTLALAARLRAPDGVIVVSEPPDGDRWPPEMVAAHGLVHVRQGPVAVFSAADVAG